MSVKQDLVDGERRAAQRRREMGNAAYEAWVQSRETRYYTSFSSEAEVKEFMRKAGYDYRRITTNKYIYIKTHIGIDDYDCVWWLYRGEEIIAVINNFVDRSYVEQYLQKVENVTGKKVFFLSVKERTDYRNQLAKKVDAPIKEVVEEKVVEPEPIPEYTFPTIFTDTSVLQQALKNMGISATTKSDNFEFTLDGFETSIYKEGNNNYEFKIIGKCDLKNIHKYFNNIETEYNKIVQQNICENIKSKVAQSPTMRLENEQTLEDNSVLLTISI